MSRHVDAERIEVTRGERVLAAVLAVFLLVGGLWAYARIDAEEPTARDPRTLLPAAEREALRRADAADARSDEARVRVRVRREALVDRREAYRTALDAGRADAALAGRYRDAQARYDAAQAAARRAAAAARAARERAAPVEDRLRRLADAEVARAEDERRDARLVQAGLRLLLVLAALAAALVLVARLRRVRSRWLLAGYGGVGAATALAVVMALDYLTDWIDPLELGPLVLSVAGAGLTLAALAALQRHIAVRLPARRVRRGECPFCGFPVGRGSHCEGCGRAVQAPCPSCAAPRRVGAPHCAACGAA